MKIKIQETLKQHISNNAKEYILVLIIFLIGLFLGVMLVNTSDEANQNKITEYIKSYVEKVNGNSDISTLENLKTSISQKTILLVLMWFMGTTIIGIIVVFGIILIKGFCLGYTIASVAIVFGKLKGLFFIISSIFLQNILLIPAILALGVSGIKLYKSIIKDRNKENIKLEILRHTIFSAIILIVLILAAIIEVQVSGNILQKVIKYF